MGGVIEVCEAEPTRYLRAVETLVQPQTPRQAFRSRRRGSITFNKY
jgi:hypothetical protein